MERHTHTHKSIIKLNLKNNWSSQSLSHQPKNIQSSWLPGLASVADDVSNLAETSRVGGYPAGPTFSEEKGRDSVREGPGG